MIGNFIFHIFIRFFQPSFNKFIRELEGGFVNKLFGLLYPIRVFGKRIKQRSKAGYYVLKYALVAGVLYWIFF